MCVFVCADSLWLLRVFVMEEIKIKRDFKALMHLYPLSAYVIGIRAEKLNMHRLWPDKTSYSVVMRQKQSSVLGIKWARPRFILNLFRLFLSFAFSTVAHPLSTWFYLDANISFPQSSESTGSSFIPTGKSVISDVFAELDLLEYSLGLLKEMLTSAVEFRQTVCTVCRGRLA